MKQNSTSALGALHPIFFFLVVYGISLFLALFVCRTIYYGMNEKSSVPSDLKQETKEPSFTAAVVYK